MREGIMITVVVCWFVLAIVVGVAAGGRRRSGVGWFALALILSPIIVGLLLAILPDLRTHEMLKVIDDDNANSIDDRELMRNAKRGAGWHP
jgi:hypothetical protein